MLLQMLVGVLAVFFFLMAFAGLWTEKGTKMLGARLVLFTACITLALGLAFLQRFI